MLRTMAVQNGVRSAEAAPSREFDPAVGALIDRRTDVVRDSEPLSAAVDRLLGDMPCGVPVIDAGGAYRGTCTLRSVASLCLLINGETAALMPSLGFLRDDLERIRQRLGASLTMPAVQATDPFVPLIGPTATLPEIFFHFYRGHSLLPVVEGDSRRFIGTISCEQALRSVLNRPAGDGR
jgi:hypothetical protein